MALWGHRKGHGLHSPFVFDLVTRVFRNKISSDIVSKIEKMRKKMISDSRMLDVRDLGSGSKNEKKGLIRLKKIARYSPVPQKYGILLGNMAAEFGEPYIIEFGTSTGISTMYMASCTKSIVYTMEGCQAVSEVARENFAEGRFDNIKQLTGEFEELIPAFSKLENNPGLIFIDGNHRKGPVLEYFSRMCDIAGEKTVIIFDDISYSKEMEEAWEMIRKDERISLAVDIRRMGIVFFRKNINRGYYRIRY